MSLFKPIQILVEWVPPPVSRLDIKSTWPQTDEDIPSGLRAVYVQTLDIIQLECLAVEREMVGSLMTPMKCKQIEAMLLRTANYAYNVTSVSVEFTFKWQPLKPKHKCSKCGHEDEG